MSTRNKKNDRVFRVVLVFPLGETRSVFVKASSRPKAERKALRKYPKSTQVDRSPNPLS